MTNILTKEQIIEKYQGFPDWKTIQEQNPAQNKILVEHYKYDGLGNGLMLYKGKKCYYIRSEYTPLKYFDVNSEDPTTSDGVDGDPATSYGVDGEVDNIEWGSVHLYYVYAIPEESLVIIEECNVLYLEMLKEHSMINFEKYEQTIKEVYGNTNWIEKSKTWTKVGRFKVLNLY